MTSFLSSHSGGSERQVGATWRLSLGAPWLQQHLQIPCSLQCWPWPQAACHLLTSLLVWVLTGLGADAVPVQPTRAF